MTNAFWAVFGALASWFITHRYYRKSLREQQAVASTQLEEVRALAQAGAASAAASQQLLRMKRVEECITEHRRAGTPVRAIDAYEDLSSSEKADLMDTVMLRVKGRKAKSNPYRRA